SSELSNFSAYQERVGHDIIPDLESRIYTLVAHSSETGITMTDEAVRFSHFEPYIAPYLGGRFGCLNMGFHKQLHDDVIDHSDDFFGEDWNVSLQEIAVSSKDWPNVTLRILHRALISGCITTIDPKCLEENPALQVMAAITAKEFKETGDGEVQRWSHSVW